MIISVTLILSTIEILYYFLHVFQFYNLTINKEEVEVEEEEAEWATALLIGNGRLRSPSAG